MVKVLKICMILLFFVSCSKSKSKNDFKKDEVNSNTSFVINGYPHTPNYYKILEKVTYHSEDLIGVNANKWIGLYQNANGYYLQETEVFLRTVHDDILDEQGQNTGKEIVISNDEDVCKVLLGNSI